MAFRNHQWNRIWWFGRGTTALFSSWLVVESARLILALLSHNSNLIKNCLADNVAARMWNSITNRMQKIVLISQCVGGVVRAYLTYPAIRISTLIGKQWNDLWGVKVAPRYPLKKWIGRKSHSRFNKCGHDSSISEHLLGPFEDLKDDTWFDGFQDLNSCDGH